MTSATTTTLTDTAQTFSSSLVGDEVIITSGSQAGEKGTVSAVPNSNALSVSFSTLPGAGSAVAPAAGSSYIVGLADTSTYTAASLVAGSGASTDGSAYSANNPEYSDQYVAKHFPFPWFESLTGVGGSGTSALTEPVNGGTNCDANHIANLDNPSDGLVSDLVDNTVPNFSWITPDNCSDGHDSSCKGNNLSGAFGLNGDGTISTSTTRSSRRPQRRGPTARPPARSHPQLRPEGDDTTQLHRWRLFRRPDPGVLRPADRALPRRSPTA